MGSLVSPLPSFRPPSLPGGTGVRHGQCHERHRPHCRQACDTLGWYSSGRGRPIKPLPFPISSPPALPFSDSSISYPCTRAPLCAGRLHGAAALGKGMRLFRARMCGFRQTPCAVLVLTHDTKQLNQVPLSTYPSVCRPSPSDKPKDPPTLPKTQRARKRFGPTLIKSSSTRAIDSGVTARDDRLLLAAAGRRRQSRWLADGGFWWMMMMGTRSCKGGVLFLAAARSGRRHLQSWGGVGRGNFL